LGQFVSFKSRHYGDIRDMKTTSWDLLFLAVLPVVLAAGGCQKEAAETSTIELTSPAELGPTVGSQADVMKPQAVAVEGYGLVGGLAGTGSAFCPPPVLAYLKRYILAQSSDGRVNVDELLNSKNVAVVYLEAEIPPTAAKDEPFDVRVTLPPGSETGSIQGGWLYKAELMPRGTFGRDTRILATVEGPVFVDPLGTAEPDLKSGYLLGGGRPLVDFTVLVRLRRASYRNTSVIRNRLSERYGPNVVRAISPTDIEVRIPPKYQYRKERFVQMIPATFVEVTNELTEARVSTFVQRLAVSDQKESSEVALEAIGRDCLPKLGTLLNASDAEVRLRAARCMLGLDDDRGLAVLRELAQDKKSPYRLEALEAVVVAGRRSDASALAHRLLRDDDVAVVQAAYEHLRRIEDPSVTGEIIGRSFLLEQVVQTPHKAIFVARSGAPRVVLFGAPLACRENIFVESPDKDIVVDARAGQDYVSVFRHGGARPGVLGPVRTSRDLRDVVHALGDEPRRTEQGQLRALGVSYADVMTLLEQMTTKGAVAAQFWAGPLPKMAPPVKK
jgi:flagellar basal body P-ring protein FlgI